MEERNANSNNELTNDKTNLDTKFVKTEDAKNQEGDNSIAGNNIGHNNIRSNDVKNSTSKKNANKKSRTRMYIVLLFILAVVLIGYIIFRGEYLEILEIGEEYISIFWQNVNYAAITFGINFILLFIIIYINNSRIKKALKPFFELEKREMPKLPNKSISFILSVIVSAVTSEFILNQYMLFTNATAFGVNDPVFGIDIGYFMFQKPFIETMLIYAILLIVGLTVYTVIYYIAVFNICFDGVDREALKKSKLLKQLFMNIKILAIFLAGFVLIKTQDIGFDKFLNLQEDTTYSIYGAGVTDVTIKLWGYRILPILIILSVFMAIRAFNKGKTKKIIMWVLAVPIYIIVLLIVMAIFQAIFITPNELDREEDNIRNNINFTKEAYGIDADVFTIENGGETITEDTLNQLGDTINNIVIVDKDTVLKDLNTVQTEKGYYTYETAKIASCRVNGEQQLVYVSPREISNSNSSYNNQTYEYTHGYGVVVTSATDTDSNGNLIKLQKNFNTSDSDIIAITEPRIYFGLQTNNNIVTNSKNRKEFDYPASSTSNAENVYEGDAGLSLNFIDRFILGIKEGDLNLAFSANVNSDSKILTNRNIIERAKTLMPYLLYDENPYLVVNDNGELIWVLDAYTTSNYYPYSQKTTIQLDALNKLELNYIRNSVKVLINAYDGTIKFYITDITDPIASAYEKIYPDLFVDKDEEIPSDISSQFIYPEFLYNIQADIILRYHDIQPDVLYRGDDVWDVATHNTGRVSTKTGVDIEPYYTMVKTIDSDESRLGLVLPFTPVEKQNITSYMVATYEGGAPKLTIYKFASDSNILGPMQLDTQIEQDADISSELEALNVTGTRITKNMIIVPLDNTLLYVEPVYQEYINEEDSVPTLRKVIVASGNKLAIGDDINEALRNLVSQYAVDIEVENTDNVEDLIDAIIKANGNLKDSTSNSNFEMMGKDIQRLQELIDQLEVIVEEERENQEANEILANELADEMVNGLVTNSVLANEMQ